MKAINFGLIVSTYLSNVAHCYYIVELCGTGEEMCKSYFAEQLYLWSSPLWCDFVCFKCCSLLFSFSSGRQFFVLVRQSASLTMLMMVLMVMDLLILWILLIHPHANSTVMRVPLKIKFHWAQLFSRYYFAYYLKFLLFFLWLQQEKLWDWREFKTCYMVVI